MISKCKSKIEYEYMAYKELNELMEFVQDSVNFSSLYVMENSDLSIGLIVNGDVNIINTGIITMGIAPQITNTFTVKIGDYVLKDPNKCITIIAKENFEEQYSLIKGD